MYWVVSCEKHKQLQYIHEKTFHKLTCNITRTYLLQKTNSTIVLLTLKNLSNNPLFSLRNFNAAKRVCHNSIGRFTEILLCKIYGLPESLPYALSILGSIADRTTVRNGLPRNFARRQLLQQLSVTLWRYNAKMILRQYSLTAEDEFPDFDIG